MQALPELSVHLYDLSNVNTLNGSKFISRTMFARAMWQEVIVATPFHWTDLMMIFKHMLLHLYVKQNINLERENVHTACKD